MKQQLSDTQNNQIQTSSQLFTAQWNGYQLVRQESGYQLKQASVASRPLDAQEVRVQAQAFSLNARDLMVLRGQYGEIPDGRTPLSDAAGIVEAVGSDVTELKVGDRVITTFFADWLSGPFQRVYGPSARGAEGEGVFVKELMSHQSSLVRLPEYLTLEEGATLPCAAVTAWQALFERGKPLTSSDTLLVQGTGGVALFGLQLAVAMGAKVIITSSSDEKLDKALSMGAWKGVNYRTHPDWEQEVLRLTDGRGVDQILELGGPNTFERSISCAAPGGKIAQIGVLTGFGTQPNLIRVLQGNLDLVGIAVGSREHQINLLSFMTEHKIHPILDRVFSLAETDEAFNYLESGQHLGKVVIVV